MRVLVTGAYGLIGTAVMARLNAAGHALTGAGRSVAAARRRFPYAAWVVADFNRLTTEEAWLPLLAGMDAVVNCAGALQSGGRDDLERVHASAPLALFAACRRAGVSRVIQVSALGAARDGPTEFATTKAEADAWLAASDLDWLVLRPGVVLATGVYGGSAMLRGLAGVPWRSPLAAADLAVQVVSADDVAETVAWALGHGAKVRGVFELVHPDQHAVGHLVAEQRRWLGFAPQPVWNLPRPIPALVAAFADALGVLGWRSPARTTALAQLAAMPAGDPAAWIAATGIRPKSLADILAAHPSTVQDRWFARLYFLKPVAIASLSALFLVTGLVTLGPGWQEGMAALARLPVGGAAAVLVAGAVLDIVLGAALLVHRLVRPALLTMLALTPLYLLVATFLDTGLWADPFGRLLKTVPVLALMVITLAILDER